MGRMMVNMASLVALETYTYYASEVLEKLSTNDSKKISRNDKAHLDNAKAIIDRLFVALGDSYKSGGNIIGISSPSADEVDLALFFAFRAIGDSTGSTSPTDLRKTLSSYHTALSKILSGSQGTKKGTLGDLSAFFKKYNRALEVYAGV